MLAEAGNASRATNGFDATFSRAWALSRPQRSLRKIVRRRCVGWTHRTYGALKEAPQQMTQPTNSNGRSQNGTTPTEDQPAPKRTNGLAPEAPNPGETVLITGGAGYIGC